MRRLLLSCVGVLSAFALLQPAAADEPPPVKRQRAAPARVAQPAQQQQTAKWTGGQLGGSNGASSVNNSFVDPGSYVCPFGSTFGSNCFETPFQFSQHKTVYTVGPFVGYRWMLGKGPGPGSWVFGIEGDWSWKNAESSLNQASATPISITGSNFLRTDSFAGSVKQKSDSSIRARLGTLITPWTLVYVTGGVAFGEISGSLAYTGTLYTCASPSTSVSACTGSSSPISTATATTAVSWSDTRVGSTVGAGYESELFPGWKWRAEYRWTDFGDYTKTFGLATRCTSSPSSPASSCTGSPSSSVSINLKESFHTFRIGLGFDL
jgi:outer membrane immunogenic protein